MDETPISNPFDEDNNKTGMNPIDDTDTSGRTLVWALLGIIVIGCGLLFAGAFFLFQPDTRSLYAQYFPSPTASATSTPTATATVTPTKTITPTRTNTPSPTPNLTATLQAQNAQSTVENILNNGRIIISDSFDSNRNNWLVEKASTDEYATTTYEITDGKYKWTTTAHKSFIGWVRAIVVPYQDFYMSVEARQVSGPNTGDYGITLREDKDSNFYYFGINEKGEYFFAVYFKDWTTLQDWTYTDLIHPGEVNKIAVVAQGSTFTFFINDQFLAEFTDDKIAKGKNGLAMEQANAEDQAVFEFDNFEFRVPK